MNADGEPQAKHLAGGRNRGVQFRAVMWILAAAVFAGGAFLGLAPRITRACAPGDLATQQLPLSASVASNAEANPAAPEELKVGESFTDQTKDHEYRFTLDGSAETVHLHVSAEIRRGKIEWELIDPTGKVRTHIGTTDHGTMDSSDIKTIKGEWLLRVKLEGATGKYEVHWTQ